MKIKMKVKKVLPILLLQLVAFNSFWRNKADAEMVEVCAFSQLTLSCNETTVINVSSVVLGDSPGCSNEECCPKNDSCTAKPNDKHVIEVHRLCNRRQRCTVDVIQERIPCESTLGVYHKNDFERITYDCIDKRNMSKIEDYTSEPEYTPVVVTETSMRGKDAVTSGTPPTMIIVVIACLLVLIIIIVLIIVIVRLRKKTSSKIKSEVEMTGVRNGQNGIHANQNQDTNSNPNNSPASRQNDGQNCSSAIYEEPNNVVEYSVVSQDTSPAAKGAGVEYSSVDIIKSDHKAPATKSEDDGYSLAGDPDKRQSTCVDNVYEDVESKQSDSKAKSANIRSDGGACKEPKNIGGQAVSSGQSNLNSKDKKSASNSKEDEGIYKNIGEVGGTPSSPSSPYEPMTPIPSQSIYANESESVPFRTESLTSSLGSGSEAHTPYCEMRSPSVKLKDDGARMLVDNELYSQ